MTNIKTKRHDIARYWINKAIDEKTFKVIEYTGKLNQMEIMVDEYEPCCWACKCYDWEPEDKYKTFEQLWDWEPTSYYLEKCHILPKMLGGTDDPSNLFLLCKKCHYESPDTINPDNFFAWVVYKRTYETYGKTHVDNLIKAAKMKSYDYYELKSKLPKFFIHQKEFKDKVVKRCGLHFNDISEMSICMSIIDEMLDYISKTKSEN